MLKLVEPSQEDTVSFEEFIQMMPLVENKIVRAILIIWIERSSKDFLLEKCDKHFSGF